jgi:uncharacterized protein YhhL (DUF1145 family)
MGPLIAGIVALLADWLLPMAVPLPYPLHLILLIVGIVLVLYGIYVILIGHSRTGRWHY